VFGKRKQAGRPVENEPQSEPERRDPPSGGTTPRDEGLTLRLVLTPKDPPRRRDES
jgi:hypothetical protein